MRRLLCSRCRLRLPGCSLCSRLLLLMLTLLPCSLLCKRRPCGGLLRQGLCILLLCRLLRGLLSCSLLRQLPLLILILCSSLLSE
jgi:hypothetical protein